MQKFSKEAGREPILKTWLYVFAVIMHCITGNAWAEEQNTINWSPWSEQVFLQAAQEDKLVLLDLSAEWCNFCKKMDATTWRDESVIATIEQHYVAVKVQDELQPEIAERYRKYGRPAIVLLSKDGTELMKNTGYMKPQHMDWMLQAVALQPVADAHQ